MIANIVKIKIKPQYKKEFEDFMKMHVAGCKKREPGMVQFEIAFDEKDPNTYFFFEKYADHAAHVEHSKAPTLPALREKFGLWAEDRSLNVCELWPEIK